MIFAQLEHLEEYWVYRGKVDAWKMSQIFIASVLIVY